MMNAPTEKGENNEAVKAKRQSATSNQLQGGVRAGSSSDFDLQDLPSSVLQELTAGELPQFIAASQSSATDSLEPGEALPLVVWLRGDESICSDFSLSAEDAMHELGIKRTRLTQISGRELRVGRMRVDRYVRPVYRAEDVETYKNWVRASASHMKSGRAIDDAAARLEQESHSLATKVSSQTVTELSEPLSNLKSIQHEQSRVILDKICALSENLAALEQLSLANRMEVPRRLSTMALELSELAKGVKVAARIPAVEAKIGNIENRLDLLSSQLTAEVQSILVIQQQTVQSQFEQLAGLIGSVIKAQAEQKAQSQVRSLKKSRVLSAMGRNLPHNTLDKKQRPGTNLAKFVRNASIRRG